MRKLFIHNPVFRLLSPVFSGVMGYLLILLINNNVGQLQEQFLGQELYVCIGLSYIIQEFSRGLLLLFNWLPKFTSQVLMLSFQLIISLLLSISVITISISTYYTTVLGFSASYDELFLFNAIFCSITFIYILLYTSHQYLFKVNTQKLESELLFKQNIEEDFKQFKRGINPNLLFESFEVNDISSIKIYLSEDLKVSGHDGNTALNILQSIPLQISPPKEYEIISVVQENDNYRVKVAITLPEKDECDFLFDSKGQFVEINMIEVHVQEHSHSEKIELAEPLRIPFELRDDLIFIKVNIKGQSDTLNFAF
ncbi:MAG: hypothetical protein JKY69_01970, partial [Flavobacteriaceae bacterium]|nr:hypothetical protein [Flavobacteriaceae bacterium]